jgi:hypothetical protein
MTPARAGWSGRGRGIAAPFDFVGAYGSGECVGVVAQRHSRLISRRKDRPGSYTGRAGRKGRLAGPFKQREKSDFS